MKLSLCLIVKPTKEESQLLDRCLSYVHKYVDEICITQAGKKKNKAVTDVIKKYKAKESFFKWVYDFAAARNYNFSQATGDYIMWLDADDVLRGAEILPALINRMESGAIDTAVMNYLYDFDDKGVCTVKHLKTRIVRKDSVEWVGQVHEDFNPLRELNAQMVEEIEVLHLTNDKRVSESSERNLEIAQKFQEQNPDDPRSSWLMANALVMENRVDEAIVWYEQFVQESNSDEEKYLAYLNLGSLKEDDEHYLRALSLKPRYPNAYHKLGEFYYKKGKYKRAEEMFITGFTMPVPDQSIIVYNPRDYDFNPMMLLAKVYELLDKPKESLEVLEHCLKIYPDHKELITAKKALKERDKFVKELEEVEKKIEKITDKKELKKYLDSLDAQFRSHPKIVHVYNTIFIKTESSGKDIVYYCGYTDKTWTPDTAKEKGVGGSEEAVIHLTSCWAKMGYNVTVYNNCGSKEQEFNGVLYKPYWTFNRRDKQDVVILWRSMKMLDFDINADKIFVDLHDVIMPGEFTKERLEKIDKVFVKTKAHMDLFPDVQTEKFKVVPNGIVSEDFNKKVKRNHYLILNTSSPDRHLEATLDVFEELIERQPDKPWKLAWYYGWDNFLNWHSDNKELMAYYETQNARFQKLVKEGRAEGGVMISHEKIAQKYLEAGVFLYPTQFYEIHCISATKAQLAGCYTITSDFAALDKIVQYGVKIHTEGEKWRRDNTFGDTTNVQEYVNALENYDPETAEMEMTGSKEWVKDNFDWDIIAKKWINFK